MRQARNALFDDRPTSEPASVVAASVALTAAAAVLVCVLAVFTPSTLAGATAPGADVSALLAAAAVGLAWVVAVRLAVTALAAVLSHLPGVVGDLASRVAAAASPALLRSLVRVAIGASVVVAPTGLSGVAMADAGPGPAPVTTSVRVLPPGWLPVLDRVVQPAADAGEPKPPTSSPPSTAPMPPPGPPVRTTAAPPTDPPRARVVVRVGDTLWDIAARHLPAEHSDADVARAWPRWFAANRAAIGADPGLIRPGVVLQPPP